MGQCTAGPCKTQQDRHHSQLACSHRDFNGPTHGLSTFVFLFRRALLGYSTKNMNIALTLAGSEGNQATQQLDQ